MSAGAIALGCDVARGRTRLHSVRYAGLSRVSRGFTQAGGAVRVVASTLGPGIIGGDDYTVEGALDAGAMLDLCGQMATPVYAAALPSNTTARWTVAAGATLCAIAEPLMMSPLAAHNAHTAVDVRSDGVAILGETVRMQTNAHLTMRTVATIDGVLALHDALDIQHDDAGFVAFGTVIVIAPDDVRRGRIAAALHTVVPDDVRMGFGETTGSLLVRVSGPSVWDVAQAVSRLARAAAG